MGGTPIRLGPFTNGINTLSDPTALQDTELLDCSNFILDIDGSLVTRPPISEFTTGAPPGATSRILALGWVMINQTPYLIGSSNNGIYYFASNAWTLITNTISSVAMAQFDNKAWIVATPESSGTSGYWHPVEGWVTGGAAGSTLTGGMPKGRSIVVNRDRIFIGCVPDPSGSYTSLVVASQQQVTPTILTVSWPVGVNQLYMTKGDGEYVVDMVVYNNSLMIFKRHSTYVFAYDADPTLGSVIPVNKAIGVSRNNCIALYENNLYVYSDGSVYEVINNDFNKLNVKVPFLYDPTRPSPFADEVFCFTFGDLLIVRYYNRIYVFGFKTRVWTRFESTLYFGPMYKLPNETNQSIMDTYYGGSCIAAYNTRWHRWQNGFDLSNSEEMTSSILTKNYDLTIPFKFKRLFWWGVDVSTVRPVTGTVIPILFNFAPTHGQMEAYTHSQLKAGTFGQPLSTIPAISTTVPVATGAARRFIKFLKSIRFRQVRFQVVLTNNGTISTAPNRLFTAVALVREAETVVKQVS